MGLKLCVLSLPRAVMVIQGYSRYDHSMTSSIYILGISNWYYFRLILKDLHLKKNNSGSLTQPVKSPIRSIFCFFTQVYMPTIIIKRARESACRNDSEFRYCHWSMESRSRSCRLDPITNHSPGSPCLFFLPPPACLWNKHSLSTYSELITVLEAEETAVSNTDMVSGLMEFRIWWWRVTINKWDNQTD